MLRTIAFVFYFIYIVLASHNNVLYRNYLTFISLMRMDLGYLFSNLLEERPPDTNSLT